MLTALITLKAKDDSHMLCFEKVEEIEKSHHYSIWINRNSSEIVNPSLYPMFNKMTRNQLIILNYIEYKVTEVSQLIAQY
ncbi:hypothetical protein [Acinetobacter boissieri]|uniref:Uncharacterized protein n=1 Tax=Acinetobacter boissieri TaxID=1219383 RepID=A0A1G6I100_9GAMM|nr:hypothetical protein [Acinetobacter boissieri]SDC00131.1 hypothetical protein SAMN05421733_107158 [Acinetobacter boissieri]